jgi:hypothetical protein
MRAPLRTLPIALAGLLVLGCGGAEEAPADGTPEAESAAGTAGCGFGATTVLTGEGVGELRVGRTVAEIREACAVLADSTNPQGPEGMPHRLLLVEAGPDVLVAEIQDDRVFRVSVDTPRFRTADGLGVATTVAELLDLPGVRTASGEGRLFALSPSHCGLSFALGVDRGGTELDDLPVTAEVERVLAVGCG